MVALKTFMFWDRPMPRSISAFPETPGGTVLSAAVCVLAAPGLAPGGSARMVNPA